MAFCFLGEALTTVNVTLTTNLTCNYFLVAQPDISVSGSGVLWPFIVQGSVTAPVDNSVQVVTLALDPTVLWNVDLRFRGAEPVVFSGFSPVAGDLLQQLSLQGWSA